MPENKNKSAQKPGWQTELNEETLYQKWLEGMGDFAAKEASDADNAFALSLPPPNITGRLHMGHAFNATLQDIIARWRRMKGDDVLWQPATDHAGIATQAVVERELAKESNESRTDMGRESFVQKCWQWRDARGGEILQQLRRMGASCDWQRERFTLDDGLSSAVSEAFCRLFEEGLIYRDLRLINWDPVLGTAISDLEVQQQEENGFLWHIRYPLADEAEGEGIIVATTRPETLFGDAAVAVHPSDKRYQHLIGKKLRLPLAERTIPIIADDHADPEAGSGAVKITPAHDFDDYEVGKRHDLPMHDIFDEKAALNQSVPPEWQGLDRFEARKRAIAALKEQGLLVKEAPHPMVLPIGDRSGAVIEPRLMLQWFLNVESMAKSAIEAVQKGDTRFYPKTWEKTFFNWLENIRPWCLSRQLWWGHRIPVWYAPDGKSFAARNEAEAQEKATAHYGEAQPLTQDEDVLDTWFSSGLWTFSPLGWPDQTPALARYYPNALMVTGFDILFFWVARMMMLGLHFTGKVPFRDVYLHALVRDEKGQKMTKSRGNVIDPLELADSYGADALRFSFAAMAVQGRDIKLSRPRIEGYRNFITKLYNACRFCRMQKVTLQEAPPANPSLIYNRWILARLNETITAIDNALGDYRFNDAAEALYHFIWDDFCDWELELVKPVLQGEAEGAPEEVRQTLGFVLGGILRLAHPFIPFISEFLWQEEKASLLALETWPEVSEIELSPDEKDEIMRLVAQIKAIRSARERLEIPRSEELGAYIKGTPELASWYARYGRNYERLAGAVIKFDETPPDSEKTYRVHTDGQPLHLDLSQMDVGALTKTLQERLGKANAKRAKLDGWFKNQNAHWDKIPEAVREKREKERADAEILCDDLQNTLHDLGAS